MIIASVNVLWRGGRGKRALLVYSIGSKIIGTAGYSYVPQIPSLAHQYLDGTISADALSTFEALAVQQGGNVNDLAGFAHSYIDALSGAYNYGFGVACISLILSMAIYLSCRKWFKHADVNTKQAKTMENTTVNVVELSKEQTRERITALVMVFAVVIFFWMSFNCNNSPRICATTRASPRWSTMRAASRT